MLDIKFIKAPFFIKEIPGQNSLDFGKYYADYMFMMEWNKGVGFNGVKIISYGPIHLIQLV